MMRPGKILLFAGVAIAGAVLGVMAQRWYAGTRVNQDAVPEAGGLPGVIGARVGQMRPDFTLADLDGHPHPISEWDGKVVLLNFWATWCAPCRREMPELLELHHSYADQGFQVVGIAIDVPAPVRSFVAELGIDYPVLIGEIDAIEVARSFGNRLGVLPYSVVLGRDGRIALLRAGEIDRATLLATVTPLLEP